MGRMVGGRYRILDKLGEGGMGTVYRAQQISLKRVVALKVLKPELSTDALARRFNAEAELAAKLNHPNTVTLYDFGQDADGALFIAMEFLEGRSLRQVVYREAPLPAWRALAIAEQICASLSDAHAHGIVHRDLKPDNVMLVRVGKQADSVRVLDFGIAKLRDDGVDMTQMPLPVTRAGDLLGTPQYMAPEQIRGELVDARTDVYALGAMLYEMVTGRLPFEGPSPMAILSRHLTEMPVPPEVRRPDAAIAPALSHLIMEALQKIPAARPPSMDAMAERLAGLPVERPDRPERIDSGQRIGIGTYPAALYASPPPGVPLRTPSPGSLHSVGGRSPVAAAPSPAPSALSSRSPPSAPAHARPGSLSDRPPFGPGPDPASVTDPRLSPVPGGLAALSGPAHQPAPFYPSPMPGPPGSAAPLAAPERGGGSRRWLLLGGVAVMIAGGAVAIGVASQSGGGAPADGGGAPADPATAPAPSPDPSPQLQPPPSAPSTPPSSDFSVTPARPIFDQATSALAGATDPAPGPASASPTGSSGWKGGWWQGPTGGVKLEIPRGFDYTLVGPTARFAGPCGESRCDIMVFSMASPGASALSAEQLAPLMGGMSLSTDGARPGGPRKIGGRTCMMMENSSAGGSASEVAMCPAKDNISMIAVEAPAADFAKTQSFRRHLFASGVRF